MLLYPLKHIHFGWIILEAEDSKLFGVIFILYVCRLNAPSVASTKTRKLGRICIYHPFVAPSLTLPVSIEPGASHPGQPANQLASLH